MVSLTPGWWSNCTAHDQSYEAMTSDEMEIDTGKSGGPAWGIYPRTKSALLQWVLSVHDERVLVIRSLPGILLSWTGVRCQPYLQRSNFMAKEQFSNSERASSTCQAFLVNLAVASKTYQPRSDPPQSSERGESVNRDNRISLSVKTDLIFSFRGNVGCQVEQLGLCSIAKMKSSRTTPP